MFSWASQPRAWYPRIPDGRAVFLEAGVSALQSRKRGPKSHCRRVAEGRLPTSFVLVTGSDVSQKGALGWHENETR